MQVGQEMTSPVIGSQSVGVIVCSLPVPNAQHVNRIFVNRINAQILSDRSASDVVAEVAEPRINREAPREGGKFTDPIKQEVVVVDRAFR